MIWTGVDHGPYYYRIASRRIASHRIAARGRVDDVRTSRQRRRASTRVDTENTQELDAPSALGTRPPPGLHLKTWLWLVAGLRPDVVHGVAGLHRLLPPHGAALAALRLPLGAEWRRGSLLAQQQAPQRPLHLAQRAQAGERTHAQPMPGPTSLTECSCNVMFTPLSLSVRQALTCVMAVIAAVDLGFALLRFSNGEATAAVDYVSPLTRFFTYVGVYVKCRRAGCGWGGVGWGWTLDTPHNLRT